MADSASTVYDSLWVSTSLEALRSRFGNITKVNTAKSELLRLRSENAELKREIERLEKAASLGTTVPGQTQFESDGQRQAWLQSIKEEPLELELPERFRREL